MTNKGDFNGNKIILEENGNMIYDEKTLVEIFNEYYINIVENTTNAPPVSIGNQLNSECDSETVDHIIECFKHHNSIVKIKHQNTENTPFSLPLADKSGINKIIKSLDITKATGPDEIPPKIVKLSADVIAEHLTNIINFDIENKSFSENAKVAHVSAIYKKSTRTNKSNYRLVL